MVESARDSQHVEEEMGNKYDIKWLPEPEEKDYPAAESYLLLTLDKREAEEIAGKQGRVQAKARTYRLES
ncbi:MAG: hypothetical protein HY280_00640 [Nitrospinae bacterium]|nr:hypothetical protein [Nitrospinota bacterium]